MYLLVYWGEMFMHIDARGRHAHEGAVSREGRALSFSATLGHIVERVSSRPSLSSYTTLCPQMGGASGYRRYKCAQNRQLMAKKMTLKKRRDGQVYLASSGPLRTG